MHIIRAVLMQVRQQMYTSISIGIVLFYIWVYYMDLQVSHRRQLKKKIVSLQKITLGDRIKIYNKQDNSAKKQDNSNEPFSGYAYYIKTKFKMI